MHALSNKNQSGYIGTLLLISATLTLGSMEVHMALYGEGEGWEKPPHLENNLTWGPHKLYWADIIMCRYHRSDFCYRWLAIGPRVYQPVPKL